MGVDVCLNLPDYLTGIGSECAGYRKELNDIEASLVPLVFGYERLRLSEPASQLLLTKVRRLSSRDQRSEERVVFVGKDGLQSATSAQPTRGFNNPVMG